MVYIVEKIKEFEIFLQNDSQKKGILRNLTKIFTILLSVKADTSEKILNIVRIAITLILKQWLE